MASVWKTIVLALLVLQLVLGSAGVVSCAEPDGTRAMEWVAAACCDPAPAASAGEGDAFAPEPGDGCRACFDELLATLVGRPDRSDEVPALPPLLWIDVGADPLSSDERPRGAPGASGRASLEADDSPRALRPAFLRC